MAINLEAYRKIKQLANEKNAQLIAVSKTKPNESILELYNIGQRLFGENKVQELTAKQEALPKDIEWQLIGHLQSNKVKYIAPFVALIHSVDSLNLLQEINRQAQKNNRTINCLLQMYIAEEETKFGLNETELKELLNGATYQELQNIRICGLMGMATNTTNEPQIAKEFTHLKNVFDNTKMEFFSDAPFFKELSMGMSSDYKIALQKGATLIRVGSVIFGERN
jgi:hypothetical protein